MASHDEVSDRYDITGVMGPDEFHDGYPARPGTGVRNNTYANVLTAWMLRHTIAAVQLLDRHDCGRLRQRLHIDPGRLARWSTSAAGCGWCSTPTGCPASSRATSSCRSSTRPPTAPGTPTSDRQ
jgi:trehalose/maltose hydrolase-like predicted phosphorylase